MAGWTNRGKYGILNSYFRTTSVPTGFKVALLTSASAPTADTNVLADHTEITAGNGYAAGGITVEASATGFDVCTENDTDDRGFIQIKDLVWTASGGPIPASGNGARYALLLDNAGTSNALAYFDLGSDRTVSDGQTLTLQNCELRLNES